MEKEGLSLREKLAIKFILFALKILKVQEWSDKEWFDKWYKDTTQLL